MNIQIRRNQLGIGAGGATMQRACVDRQLGQLAVGCPSVWIGELSEVPSSEYRVRSGLRNRRCRWNEGRNKKRQRTSPRFHDVNLSQFQFFISGVFAIGFRWLIRAMFDRARHLQIARPNAARHVS